MVDVLKRGTPPSDKIYDVRCPHCKSELRFKQSEGNLIIDQRDGNYLVIGCPVCGNAVHKET